MVEEKDNIICEYKDKCTELGGSCKTCENNKGKKNYYVPKQNLYRWWYDSPDTTAAEYTPWNPRYRWYVTYERTEK